MSTAQAPAEGQQSWRDRKYAGPSHADREARQIAEASILAAHAAGVPQRFGASVPRRGQHRQAHYQGRRPALWHQVRRSIRHQCPPSGAPLA